MAGFARVRRYVAPLSIDAVAVLAGGYAINELTGDDPSSWWWVLAVVSGVVLVASGLWKLRIEKLPSEAVAPVQAGTTTGNADVSGNSNSVTTVAGSGDTTIENGSVSISANNHSLAAWEVRGTVYLGGSPQPMDSDRPEDSNGDR